MIQKSELFMTVQIRWSFFALLGLSMPGKPFATLFEEAMKQKKLHIPMSQSDLDKKYTASTLVVSCVDFRFRDEIAHLLNTALGLKDDYDEISLPGASLAFVEPSKPHWENTMNETIALLKDLHHIKRVIFIDHLGCGAYQLIKGKDRVQTQDLERSAHLDTFKQARQKMKTLFPDLKTYTFLMDFHGTIENIQD